MNTFESELQKLQQDHKEKTEALGRKWAVLNTLGNIWEGYKEPFIHTSKLYGTVGLISFSSVELSYSSASSVKSPDSILLKRLLGLFPPLPMVKVKFGTVHFQTDLGEVINPQAEEYECHGVIARISDIQYGGKLTLEWNAYLRTEINMDPVIWRFNVSFPLHSCKFGRLDARARRYGGQGPISSWEVCEFYPETALDAQRVRYGSGGAEYPNTFVLYWDRDSGSKLDFASLVTQPKEG